MPMLLKAVNSDNRNVHREALKLMKPYANQEVVDKVIKKCKARREMLDVVDWLAEKAARKSLMVVERVGGVHEDDIDVGAEWHVLEAIVKQERVGSEMCNCEASAVDTVLVNDDCDA